MNKVYFHKVTMGKTFLVYTTPEGRHYYCYRDSFNEIKEEYFTAENATAMAQQDYQKEVDAYKEYVANTKRTGLYGLYDNP